MKRHLRALGLLAGGMTVMVLASGTGLARADSDPFVPAPGIIDQILTSTPALNVNPTDEGDSSSNWDGVGMYCQNLFVRCH